MLNVAKLNSVRSSTLSDAALIARQKSIVNNAIRELLHAIGYTGPFRDNDMRVAMAVEAAIHHLQGADDAVTSEHETLAPVGAETSPVIGRISEILEKGLEEELNKISTADLMVKGSLNNTNVVQAKVKKDNDPA